MRSSQKPREVVSIAMTFGQLPRKFFEMRMIHSLMHTPTHRGTSLFTVALIAFDFLSIFFTILVHYFIRIIAFGQASHHEDPGVLLLHTAVVGLLWILALAVAGVYNDEKSFLDIEHSKRTLKGLCFGIAVLMLLLYPFLSKEQLQFFAASLIVTAIIIFYGHIYLHHRLLFLKIRSGKRIIIYGAGTLGRTLFSIIGSSRHSLVPVAFLDDDPAKFGITFHSSGLMQKTSCTVLGSFNDLEEIALQRQAEELIIAISNIPEEKLHRIAALCKRLNLEMSFVPNLHGYSVYEIHATVLGDIPIVRFQPRPHAFYAFSKNCLDIICSLTLLTLLSPLLLVIALAVFLQDRRSPFFSHARTGLHGKSFQMYKFRTMHCTADPYAQTPSCSDDCRITRIGRILRKTSLDELPQLFNVLRGDMSLVGPRPEMPFITQTYTEEQRLRLRVKPGITGLWQISVDRHQAIHDNLEYDFYYIRNRSFFLDLTILLETIAFLFRGI